jgi:hypothetical protein
MAINDARLRKVRRPYGFGGVRIDSRLVHRVDPA